MTARNLSRRAALTATGVSIAILAPSAAIGAIIDRSNPDPVVALGEAERAAWSEYLRISGERDRREGLHQLIGRPKAMLYGKNFDSPEDLTEYAHRKLLESPMTSEFRDALRKIIKDEADALRRAIAAHKKARNDTGITALVAAEDAACTARYALVDKIIATPAQSFAGLAVKLLILSEDMEIGDSEMQGEMVASALADAARLAGGAA